MAIREYYQDGNSSWSVYVNIRHKEQPQLRRQKTVKGFKTEQAALQEEKRLIRTLTHEVNELAERGIRWGELVNMWEIEMRSPERRTISATTYLDNLSLLNRWTTTVWNMYAKEIGLGDWVRIFKAADAQGKSRSFAVNLKAAINGVYRYSLEKNLIRGLHQLPTDGLVWKKRIEEHPPQILKVEEIRRLLREARAADHPWYSVWVLALLTGMRSGELQSLLWTDIDFERGIIVVSKSYNPRFKIVKSTKAGYWRNVPISSELKTFLTDLKATATADHVLPRFRDWEKGQQARPLRMFCRGIGLQEIKFHTLRACFATQLLANGIQPAKVMKICGWRDLATMERYVRLAGIDEMGATECLKVIESDHVAAAQIVNLLDFKAKRP